MHACKAQCVFNTNMHDVMHVFARKIKIISKGPDVTIMAYIEAMGGCMVSFTPLVL